MDIATVKTINPSEGITFQDSLTISPRYEGDKRTFEGWFSVGGIDWEDEDAPSTAKVFQEAADEYLRKNPVILWDHKRDFPIGKAISIKVHEGVGVHVVGEILGPRDFGYETSEDGESSSMELLNKCNEVWELMKRGIVKGLSWKGRVRKQWAWSDDLNKYVKRAKKVLLIYEVTVTPVQVHPSAQITQVNTMAKALEMSKALPLTIEGKGMSEQVKRAQEAQEAYIKAMRALEDGVDLPQEMLDRHNSIGGAMQVEEVSEKSLEMQVKELTEQINALKSEPAPLRNQTGQPTGSKERPVEGASFEESVEKSLNVMSNVENGVTDRGAGKACYVTAEDTVKMLFLKSKGRIEHRGQFSVSPACQQLLQEQGVK